MKFKRKINLCAVFLVLIGAIFLMFKYFNLSTKVVDVLPKHEFHLSIGDTALKSGVRNIVFTKILKPNISIYNEEGVSLSIDESLNVLNDHFYGDASSTNAKIDYVPNFVLTPGPHKLVLANKNGDKEEFDIVISYHDDFSSSLKSNHFWIVPKTSVSSWFSVQDEKLKVVPDSDIANSSLAFIYNLTHSFVIDFEFTPLGKNIDAVPYIINSVRNEFVLGSNSDIRNVLFHTDSDGRQQIDGQSFLWKKNSRYQIRIRREDNKVSLLIRDIVNEERVDPIISDTAFKEIVEFTDKENGLIHPYGFGISAWKNTDGFLIDDVYITSL